MESLFFEVFITVLLGIICGEVSSTGEVVYAVNSGGPAHTDLNGVHFQADKLAVGTASDFGKSLSIGRVAPADQILYQTERYHFSNFGYTIPIKENGDYVLILKFCEVYFQGPRLKVFDVAVNQHTVIKGLDIYERVGRGVGHDEYIPFRVNNNQLLIDGETVPFGGSIYVEFLKGRFIIYGDDRFGKKVTRPYKLFVLNRQAITFLEIQMTGFRKIICPSLQKYKTTSKFIAGEP